MQSQWLFDVQKRVAALLTTLFESPVFTSIAPLVSLGQAMAYACQSGGKRIRPALVYAACDLFGGDWRQADRAALAVEVLHAYSLVHDDLPAMDDDALRRGLPTCHIQFDEATAILTGDALQTLAFELLLGNFEVPDFEVPDREPRLSSSQQLAMMQALTRASGVRGMVAGQSLDLLLTGFEASQLSAYLQNKGDQLQRLAQRPAISSKQALIDWIHHHKTSCLIVACVEMGAIAADIEVNSWQMQALRTYAEKIGLAFQIQDDILDATRSTAQLGKTAGADAQLKKLTYPTVLGLEASKQAMIEAYDAACHALAPLSGEYQPECLLQLADTLVRRDY